MKTLQEFAAKREISLKVAKQPDAHIAQSVEHFLGKEEVIGSIPIVSTKFVWRGVV